MLCKEHKEYELQRLYRQGAYSPVPSRKSAPAAALSATEAIALPIASPS